MSAVVSAGLPDISPGEPSSRQEWREGYAAGQAEGYRRTFQSPVLETMALELTLLREAVQVLSAKVTALEWSRDEYREWCRELLRAEP